MKLRRKNVRRGGGGSKSLALSVVLHLGLLGLLILSFNLATKPMGARPQQNTPIVQAQAVDEQQVQQELDAIKQREEEKRQQEVERQEKLEQLEKQRQQKEQEIRELEQKRKQEEVKRKEAEKQRKVEEAKRVEAEKKRKAEEEKRKKAEAVKERKRKEAERKKAAEAKKRAEAERKKAEAARAAKEAAERQAVLAARASAEFNRYAARIQQKVENNWRYSGQQCRTASVLVKLLPGGVVQSARVTRGSGDPAFDRSVEAAFLQATPLPIPPETELFQFYKEINFKFDPCR